MYMPIIADPSPREGGEEEESDPKKYSCNHVASGHLVAIYKEQYGLFPLQLSGGSCRRTMRSSLFVHSGNGVTFVTGILGFWFVVVVVVGREM
mmetsp:Transcript_2520/g.4009  ORF Transcript_2520/g.4009 Transcript_2520/m.4009 type:complete len:93 (+) Transcript_2520:2358-2636(+)